MTVRAGRLRHRVRIQKLTKARDDLGSLTETFEDVGTYWCELENTKSMIATGEVRQSQDTIVLKTRYNKFLESVTNSMYADFRGIRYEVDSVINPRKLNEMLLITCIARGE